MFFNATLTPSLHVLEGPGLEPGPFLSQRILITENYRPATDSRGLDPHAFTAPTVFQTVPARLSGLLSN